MQLLAVASLLVSCRQLTPEERIEIVRSRYTAELTGFVVEQEPLTALVQTETGAEEAPEVDVAAAPEEGEEPVVPLTSNIVFDLLVRTESTEKLAGITLDVSHADAEEEEKDHRLIWLDVSGVDRGPGTQFTYVVEDVDYRQGDRFHVEVRSPIAAEERADYREFGGQP
jgi:hypothetical protein